MIKQADDTILHNKLNENVEEIRNGNKRSRFWIIKLLLSIVVITCVASVVYIMFFMPANQLEYVIKRNNTDVRYLDVEVRVQNLRGFYKDKLRFYKSSVNAPINSCWDEKGRITRFTEKDRVIEIDVTGKRSISFSYTVRVGDIGRHGHQGQSYDDMLVFIGGNVLIVPYEAYDDTILSNKVNKIKSISMSIDVPKQWTAVVPFAETAKGDLLFNISLPTWREYYTIIKSCYAFGEFDKHVPEGNGDGLTVYVDPKARHLYTDEAKQGIDALYDYFTNLFNCKKVNFSFVMLRNDPADGRYIMGSLSPQTLGSTFNPQRPRDWELLAHRMMHAFVDTHVVSSKYAAAPQFWYYEGIDTPQYWFYEAITTYYENMAMDSFPEQLKQKLGVEASQGLYQLFRRYLYMRLKDPAMYAIIPLKEQEISDISGKIEFLHYTQAPLILKALDDIGNSVHGRYGVPLEYILSDNAKNLTVDNIVRYVAGNKADEFINRYLYGQDILPLWNIVADSQEDSGKLIAELNSYEEAFESYMKVYYPEYVKDVLIYKDLIELSAEADRQNLSFASEEVETTVKNISHTIYHLLKQHALRAKVCGIDLNDPDARVKLLADEQNVQKWETFKRDLTSIHRNG